MAEEPENYDYNADITIDLTRDSTEQSEILSFATPLSSSCFSPATSVLKDTNELTSLETFKHSPKRRRTDPIWSAIEVIGNKQYCQICRKEYSIHTGITTIKTHFKRHHSKQWDAMFVQTSLDFPVEPYGKKDEKKVTRLVELLVRWIVTDQQAFSTVDNGDFCALISELDPRFHLLTRIQVSQHVVAFYHQKQEILRTFFATTRQKFAITTDAWTSRTNLGYLAITLHWIDEDWTWSHFMNDTLEIILLKKSWKRFLITILVSEFLLQQPTMQATWMYSDVLLARCFSPNMQILILNEFVVQHIF